MWTSPLDVVLCSFLSHALSQVHRQAFLWMRCLPPSLSLVFHIFRLSISVTTGAIGVPDFGPEPREFCLFRRAGDSTSGRATFDRGQERLAL